MHAKYGPVYFSCEEHKALLKKRLKMYYRFLGKNSLLFRKKEFWKYHIDGLKEIGYPFSVGKLIAGLFSESIHMLFNLQETVERINRFVKKKISHTIPQVKIEHCPEIE